MFFEWTIFQRAMSFLCPRKRHYLKSIYPQDHQIYLFINVAIFFTLSYNQSRNWYCLPYIVAQYNISFVYLILNYTLYGQSFDYNFRSFKVYYKIIAESWDMFMLRNRTTQHSYFLSINLEVKAGGWLWRWYKHLCHTKKCLLAIFWKWIDVFS